MIDLAKVCRIHEGIGLLLWYGCGTIEECVKEGIRRKCKKRIHGEIVSRTWPCDPGASQWNKFAQSVPLPRVPGNHHLQGVHILENTGVSRTQIRKVVKTIGKRIFQKRMRRIGCGTPKVLFQCCARRPDSPFLHLFETKHDIAHAKPSQPCVRLFWVDAVFLQFRLTNFSQKVLLHNHGEHIRDNQGSLFYGFASP